MLKEVERQVPETALVPSYLKEGELSGEVLYHSPISQHCEAVLAKPPKCYDFRGIRSWVMCRAFQILETQRRVKLPVGEAWREARRVCQKEEPYYPFPDHSPFRPDVEGK